MSLKQQLKKATRRILIIGAGPTGLGAAYRLNELGHTNFCVYEKNQYVGGLSASFTDNKGFLWDFAVHVAHSHYHYFDQLMKKLLPNGYYHHQRLSWIREYGRYIPYPFQYNLRHLPHEYTQECVQGLLALAEKPCRDRSGNFHDWILSQFGSGIAKHFMFPFNRKIWATDLRRMGYQWIGDRVPGVNLERVLQHILLNKDDVSWGPNATFMFPKRGGTGAIWSALAKQLPAERLRLGVRLVGLDVKKQIAVFSDGTIENYDEIISSMPLNELLRLCGKTQWTRRAARLRFTHTHVVGVAPFFPLPKELHDKTWIYCPEDTSIFYRVTPFSKFSPTHVPIPGKQCSLMCEISVSDKTGMGTKGLIAATLSGLKATGILDPGKRHPHVFLMSSPYGYPVPTTDRDDILNEILPALKKLRILSRGRFGGWKYEVGNMDHSLMQGVEAAEHLLLNKTEKTLFNPNLINAGKR